jgi:hypothetical protein
MPYSAVQQTVLQWLLTGDPAIRFQTLRDLVGAPPETLGREQNRIAEEGWAARILALQDADGRWDRGIYSPKWTSTMYTMLLLRGFGLSPGHSQAIRGCKAIFDAGAWSDGGINFWSRIHKHSETCVSSVALAIASWFGFDDPRVDGVADYLIRQQMADGGWNCLATPGYGSAIHGSFHTTIQALEALLEYEQFRPSKALAARQAQVLGREFLLVHRLFRSHRTGKVVKPSITRFSYPPRWYYDVLRGLDYFRACAAGPDPRFEDAFQILGLRRRTDGCWPLQNDHPGRVFFRLENIGEPSRWNTLRALRVLSWRQPSPISTDLHCTVMPQ